MILGEMSCSDGETCCQLQSGDYGCCPLRKNIYFFIRFTFWKSNGTYVFLLADAVCCSKWFNWIELNWIESMNCC